MSEFDIIVPSPNDGITRASWLGSARQCADTAKIALPLSMVLVVVFCLPQACDEAVQVETVMSEIDIFVSQQVSSLWTT